MMPTLKKIAHVNSAVYDRMIDGIFKETKDRDHFETLTYFGPDDKYVMNLCGCVYRKTECSGDGYTTPREIRETKTIHLDFFECRTHEYGCMFLDGELVKSDFNSAIIHQFEDEN